MGKKTDAFRAAIFDLKEKCDLHCSTIKEQSLLMQEDFKAVTKQEEIATSRHEFFMPKGMRPDNAKNVEKELEKDPEFKKANAELTKLADSLAMARDEKEKAKNSLRSELKELLAKLKEFDGFLSKKESGFFAKKDDYALVRAGLTSVQKFADDALKLLK